MGLKILRTLFIVYGLLSLNNQVYAQCPGGVPPQQMAQTTIASIDGDMESFPFDQFDPSLGTLIGVDIDLKVTGLIAMTVINYNTSPRPYDVGVMRKDEFKSPGLGIELIIDTTVNYTTPTLPGSLHPGTPPAYFDRAPNNPALGEPPNWDSRFVDAPVDREVHQAITDPGILAAYVGLDAVELEYSLKPGFSLVGGGGQSQGIITTYATNIDLTITYTYCPNSILPGGNKLSFQASKKSNRNVLLTWTKEKEESNILYTPEVSFNGQDFAAVGNMQSRKPESDATVVKYEFGYDVPANTNGKLYFRLKQLSATGEISYSGVKIINIQNTDKQVLSLYPNPAGKQVELRFNTPQKQKLQVDVINSVGQVVESKGINLNGAQQHTFLFSRAHQPGVYFMRVFNPATREQQVVRLLIQ
ncbi:MAG: T9SS type A sorting domain-containing protein [Chitinophagaceae bacterium]|nr:T9SS type A sorting domain-containing protein [Chitinophagaceae bacterium]